MSKIIDMSGKKMGRLTVLERAPRKSSDQRAKWICQCDCGKIITTTGVDLRSGHTKSCGCYQRDRTSESCRINLIGQTIGNFTVLDYVQKTLEDTGYSKWRCRCNLCGNENALIETGNLQLQYSCGCAVNSHGERKIEKLLTQNKINFIKEKRFSDLRFEDTNHLARFDFYVDNKYLIEYDGRQHFIEGNGVYDNNSKFQRTQDHDKIKNQYCLKNNIPLIRIPYTHLEKITLNDLIPETSPFLINK